MRFAAICAVRSPSRSCGVRTFASTRARTSSTSLPRRTSRTGGNDEPFLVELPGQRHRPRAHAAHVRMVRAVGDVVRRTRAPALEHGRHQRDVRQVRAAPVRVVEHHHVAGPHVDLVDGGPHGERHRAEVHRDVIGLCDGLAARVVDGARVVAPLLDVGREPRSAERDPHLLGDRHEQVLEHLELDRIERTTGPARTAHRVSTTLPMSSTRKRQPGATTVVACGTGDDAGPLGLVTGPELRPARRRRCPPMAPANHARRVHRGNRSARRRAPPSASRTAGAAPTARTRTVTSSTARCGSAYP